jgi:hypothetical protein
LISAISLFAEILTTPPTTDAHLAMKWILRKPMGDWFWYGGVGLGHVFPMLILASGMTGLSPVAAVLALAGLYIIEWLWVLAPQHVPLS